MENKEESTEPKTLGKYLETYNSGESCNGE